MKYLIDTSSLIDLNCWYNMNIHEFEFVWDLMDGMIKRNSLNSSIVVENEIKDKIMAKWCRSNKNFYISPSEKDQIEVSNLLTKYPNLIKLKSNENSDADVFLIALAKNEDYCIVTSERLTNTDKPNIPNICKAEGIHCIETRQFIYEIFKKRINSMTY